MTSYKKINLLTKIQINVTILFTIIFTIGIISLFFVVKSDIIKRNNVTIENRLKALNNIVNTYIKRDKDFLNLASNIAEDIINRSSDIEENTEKTILYDVVDPYTGKSFKVKINDWLVDDISIMNNYILVDQIAKLSRADIAIYQKTDKAYVNISTSSLSISKERMLGDIILNNSPIVATIEQDNRYTKRVRIDNYWYNVSYKPIYIDGQIKGLYYIKIKEKIERDLKSMFISNFTANYSVTPFLITLKGQILIHPHKKQGTDLSQKQFFEYLKKENKTTGYFEYIANKSTNKKWVLQYKYNEATKSYICVTYLYSEPLHELYKTVTYASIGFVLFIILFQISFRLAYQPLKKELNSVKKVITSLINNQKVLPEELPKEQEFIDLTDLAHSVTEKYRDLAEFADGLANDNFAQPYPKSLINDKLGETLIVLNDKLSDAIYNENLRRKDEKLRDWETEGLSKFVNILQKNRDNLEELCDQLISELVQYLDANIGSLFFINSDNTNDIYFEQMATYAFEQKKYIDKKIYPEQGFIGRIYTEKETIYLTEIPENYITIASGLGMGSPKNLLIVPLLINKEVYGAIEIASFNTIKGFQIEFLEKISENIASTINNILINNKTKDLLNKSIEKSDSLSIQEEEMRNQLKKLQEMEQNVNSSIFANKDIFNSIENTILIAEINKIGLILFVNDILCDFFKLSKNDLINKHYNNYSNYISAEEYKKLSELWRKLENGKSTQSYIKIKSGAGKVNNILVSMIPQINNNQFSSVVIMGVIINNTLLN